MTHPLIPVRSPAPPIPLPRRGFILGAAAGAFAATSTIAGDIAASGVVIPQNEWPDPQFCIQDANLIFPAIDDSLAGIIPPVAFSANTTGSNTVVCSCSNTAGLLVGSLGVFGAAADANLRALGTQPLVWEIMAVTPNVSFTVVGEPYRPIPRTSAASTFQIVLRGAASAYPSGNVTSNVQRFGAAMPKVWISDRPAHTSLLKGCRRVVVAQLVAAGQAVIYWQPPIARLAAMTGTRRAVGLAAVVANGAGATAQAFINVGAIVPGGPIATGGARAWLSTSAVCGGGTYQAGALLSGPAGSTFVLGEFTECGALGALPDGSFSTPRGQIIRVIASMSPWIGETLTFPASGKLDVNMRQASGGSINEGVSYMAGLLEGQSATVGDVLNPMMAQGAVLYSPWLHQLISATGHGGDGHYYAQAFGNFQLDDKARLLMTGTPGDTWSFVSWDLSMFGLFVGP